MASSGGGAFSQTPVVLQNSGSEEDLQRKRKRMISNRESAKRSRLRKQKYLEELMNQVTHFRKENSQIIAAMNATTQNYINVEADNSVLRAQVAELSHRLQSLNEIIDFLNATSGGFSITEEPYSNCFADDPFINLFSNNMYVNQIPLMASADISLMQIVL